LICSPKRAGGFARPLFCFLLNNALRPKLITGLFVVSFKLLDGTFIFAMPKIKVPIKGLEKRVGVWGRGKNLSSKGFSPFPKQQSTTTFFKEFDL